MRRSVRGIFAGAAVLLAGILCVTNSSMEAADPVPDSDYNALVEQDAKNIVALLTEAKIKKTADRGVKSSAIMIAAYAQSRLGKVPADDAKLATLRDTAIKVAQTGGKKKYADALAPAKLLAVGIAPAAKVDTKPIVIEKVVECDMEELMYQFKKTAIGGLGIEEEIKANAKKVTIAPEKASAIGQRVLLVADFCTRMEPSGGFSAMKPKKDWIQYNTDMVTAAKAIIEGSKGKDVKKLADAFTKLDASCVACHNKFK